jgi:type II secretory pathway pseudopilin PulG
MRKAFTLIELLVLVAVVPIVLMTISRLFATFIRDLPRETKVVEQSTTLQNLLVQIRRDVDQAVALPAQFGETQAGEKSLLIERPDAVVCYQFETGQATRTVLKSPDATHVGEQRTWHVPDAVISCRLWTQGNSAYAVEIHSHVQQKSGTLRRSRLVGEHVLFLHGLGKVREVQ